MKLFFKTILMMLFFSNIMMSQNVTIDYAGLDYGDCNIFGAQPSIGGVTHGTIVGQPRLVGGFVEMRYQYADNTELGTAYNISYNFKQNHTYNIIVTSTSTTNTNQGSLKLLLNTGSAVNPNCNGMSYMNSLPGNVIGAQVISGTNLVDYYYSINSGLASNYSRLLLATSCNQSTANNFHKIRKIQIIEIPPPPTFNLSPTSLSIPCNNLSPRVFTVSNVYNSSGTLSYNWSIGSGWKLGGVAAPATLTTTTNSITLTPATSNILPGNVSVTPVFNGANKPTKTCNVTRAPITINPTITGSSSVCALNSDINYVLSGIGARWEIDWSIDDTSVATIVSSFYDTVTIQGLATGTAVLTATISNGCNQSIQRNINIHFGGPTLNSFTCGNLGRDFCSGNPIEIESNTLPILDLNDKVFANFSGMTASEANVNTNWEWQTLNNSINLNGTLGQRRIGLLQYGVTGLKVRAKNACGWSDWYQLDFELVEVPPVFERNASSTIFSVAPNPSNDLIKIKVSKDAQSIDRNGIQAHLYNMLNVVKSSVKLESGEAVIDVKGLEKGTYVLKIRYNEKEEVHQMIIN